MSLECRRQKSSSGANGHSSSGDSIDYRSYLREALASRKARGAPCSISALSRQVGVGRSFLSEVFAGKKNLSVDAAAKIMSRLEFDDEQAERFLLMVQLESARDPESREVILRKLRGASPGVAVYDLSVDLFRTISDWYHLAVLQLTQLKGFTLSPQSAAKRLRITPMEAQVAIERLIRLELLERDKDGAYRATRDYVLVHSKIPQTAVLSFHRQLLEKAISALGTQGNGERIGRTEVLPLDRSLLPKAEAILDRAAAELVALSKSSSVKSDVFAAPLHLFSLTHERK